MPENSGEFAKQPPKPQEKPGPNLKETPDEILQVPTASGKIENKVVPGMPKESK